MFSQFFTLILWIESVYAEINKNGHKHTALFVKLTSTAGNVKEKIACKILRATKNLTLDSR